VVSNLGAVDLVVVGGVLVCPFPQLLFGEHGFLMIVIALLMVLVAEIPAVVALTCPSPSVHPCLHHSIAR
jgi:hypothetical protein